jgi:uncharacterized membrane protein
VGEELAEDRSGRFAAIDWMRGLVMVLMAVDHSSAVFNGGRLAHDSIYDLVPLGIAANDPPLAVGQFLTRWVSHLCAPTFLFLSGTSLALSTSRRIVAGARPFEIDRHLCARGLVLLGFEALWLSLLPSAAQGRYLLFLQVLFAIGLSIVVMVPLRRLSAPWLAALGIAWFAFGEWLTLGLVPPGQAHGPLSALTLVPAASASAAVLYPVLPWLAMMLLGWAFGNALLLGRIRAPALACALAGLASLAAYALVRGVNAYGNMALLRRDDSLVEWLHVSKYPPSLAFACLELGVMALCLALFFAWERRGGEVRRGNPLLVLGQTALFFYVLHFPLLGFTAAGLGMLGGAGLATTWLGGLAVCLVLYPACRWYRTYKSAHPASFARFV